MDVQNVLSRFEGVKGGNGQWYAQCPAHKDKHQSLSISQGDDGRILFHCHAGCSTEAVAAAIGLEIKDLFPSEKPRERASVVATYRYMDENGELLAEKLRKSDKSFSWRRPVNSGWAYNRQGVPHTLYTAGEKSDSVFVCEGEKDADNLAKLGFFAVSGADGAGPGKWRAEYTKQLAGKAVAIFQDHDDIGRAYAQETAAALSEVVTCVRVLDLARVWPEIPPHGDVSDLITKFGPDKATDMIVGLIADTTVWEQTQQENEQEHNTVEKQEKRPLLTLSLMEAYLEKRKISIRYNVIGKEFEIAGVSNSFNPETIAAELHIILYDDLKLHFQCNKDLVADLLSVIAGKNRFNPVLDLLTTTVWDGKDYINELFDILHIPSEDKLSRVLIAKWCCQGVAMAGNQLKNGFGADGLLVIQGLQGIGKTTLVRVLGLKPEYVKLGQYIDSHDKDTMRRCTSAWICELGEIETTLRSDLERLKAFITAERDEYRLPYGRADQTHVRRTSFIATCNSEQFLIDPTGSRRFWTVPLTSIDLDRLNKFNALQMWAQVKTWVDKNEQCFRLTREEQAQLAERNAAHEKPLKAQLEVEDIITDATGNDDVYIWKYETVSAYKEANYSLRNYSVEQIGRALSRIGIEATRKKEGGVVKTMRKLPFKRFGDFAIYG